jgi:chromosome segregation ATPase
MRIGTTLILIVVILISFGYVLSDDQKNIQKVKEISGEVNNMKSQLVQANQKVNSCQETVNSNQQTISQQGSEIAALNDKISAKENEISFLQTEISQQTNKVSDLEGTLVKLQEFKAQGQQTTDTAPNSNPIIAAVIVITQVALAIFQKKQKIQTDLQIPFSRQQDNSQNVRLTADELENIVRMRRTRKQ